MWDDVTEANEADRLLYEFGCGERGCDGIHLLATWVGDRPRVWQSVWNGWRCLVTNPQPDLPDRWFQPVPEFDIWVKAPDMQVARDRAETAIMDASASS